MILALLGFGVGFIIGVLAAIGWVMWRVRGVEWDGLTGH